MITDTKRKVIEMNKILVIEDDIEINNLIYECLKKEQYEIVQSFDGNEALIKFNESINLIVLDLMLPIVDGIEVLRQIRQKSNIPIIILSAKDEENDRILGLSMGADDYMVKPFGVRELAARVKAHLRRYVNYNIEIKENTQKILIFGNIKIDLVNYKVFKDNQEISLTKKEFEILKLFMVNNNKVFTKAEIFEKVWNDEYYNDDNTVMVHIKRLRNKIEQNPKKPKIILTVWGIGYKLGDNNGQG